MKILFQLLQKNTSIFGQTQQLNSCWTDEYKAFSTFRVWVWKFISCLQTQCEIRKSKCETQKQTPCITKCVPLQLCSLLRRTKFRSLYKWPSVSLLTLNISSSLVDFIFCRRQYPWRNSKRNGRITSGTWFCVSSWYQHAACYLEHGFA